MKDSQQKKHSRAWIWILVVTVVIVSGGYFWYHQTYATSNDTASPASTTSSQSQSTAMGSSDDSKAANANGDQPAPASHGPKLASDIGPRETAAAITFYGAKKLGNGMFNGTWTAAVQNQQLLISIGKIDSDDDQVQDPGMGAMYSLAPGETDSTVGYTLGQDGTVYFYTVTNPMKPMQEIGQASKSEVISFANQHGGAADIQKLGDVARLNGDV